MANTVKRVDKIRQIVRLKQLMQRWKNMSLNHRGSASSMSSWNGRRAPSGYLAVYVGAERRRFLIPTRFLNLPVFADLLKQTEEELGFECSGGLELTCDVGFFKQVLEFLERNETRFGRLRLDEFVSMFSETTTTTTSCCCCKDVEAAGRACHVFTPLLEGARV